MHAEHYGGLRGPEGPRRPEPRGHRSGAVHRRAAHAGRGPARRLPCQGPAHHAPGGRDWAAGGPRRAPVQRRGPEPALGRLVQPQTPPRRARPRPTRRIRSRPRRINPTARTHENQLNSSPPNPGLDSLPGLFVGCPPSSEIKGPRRGGRRMAEPPCPAASHRPAAGGETGMGRGSRWAFGSFPLLAGGPNMPTSDRAREAARGARDEGSG